MSETSIAGDRSLRRERLVWRGLVATVVLMLLVAVVAGTRNTGWRAEVEQASGMTFSDPEWVMFRATWGDICSDPRDRDDWTTLVVDFYDGGTMPGEIEANVRHACPEHLGDVQRVVREVAAACGPGHDGDTALARRLGC